MTSFADTIKQLRDARGLSQNKLAALAKYDRSYIVRLEDGSRQPSRVTVMAIADALNLSDQETDELRQAAGFAPRCNTEVERFRRLPVDVQRAVLDFAEKVVTR